MKYFCETVDLYEFYILLTNLELNEILHYKFNNRGMPENKALLKKILTPQEFELIFELFFYLFPLFSKSCIAFMAKI